MITERHYDVVTASLEAANVQIDSACSGGAIKRPANCQMPLSFEEALRLWMTTPLAALKKICKKLF